MQLRTKFIVAVVLVVGGAFACLYTHSASYQRQLLLTQVVRQARMLHKQVLLTRKWVADHSGLFVLKQAGEEVNPFLRADPEIVDQEGRHFVKRNPAMVTRELSEYSSREGEFRYRVTSLVPLNPANAPDAFERRALERISREHLAEVVEVDETGTGTVLRYLAPLYVEQACLACHADQGYRVGDVRGGLSIVLPIDWAVTSITANNRTLALISAAAVLAVALALYLLFEFLVARRLNGLVAVMARYPEEAPEKTALERLGGGDEIGRLAKAFRELCCRLEQSQAALDQAREQVFQGEKLAALGRLAAGVAHEINNPLGGMRNCVRAMADNPADSDTVRRYLPLLDKGLERIATIVRQMLGFGRPQPLRRQRLDVDGLLRDCVAVLAYAAKGVEVVLDLQVGRTLLMDGEALQQVVVNLGLNGLQAMAATGGTLTVRSRLTNDQLRLEISDTGPGIAAADLGRIFDPFFTTKEVGEGTGLGLSVSHSLVTRLGGRIEVDSAPGRGATFTVELPLAPEDLSPEGTTP